MVRNNKILQIEDLSVAYGNILALKDINIEINKGEIVALLGANGSGKSTLLKSILCIQRRKKGRILFMGKDISQKPTEDIVASGITYIPEGGGILPLMTVKENLLLGAIHYRGDINKNIQKVYNRFPVLKERENQIAGTLSGGQRQMLAIGRALMSLPTLMMLDEPSMGLAPLVITEVFKIVAELAKEGLTVVLSEQNARKALQIADHAYIFQVGSIILSGTGKELLYNQGVQDAYLGGLSFDSEY